MKNKKMSDVINFLNENPLIYLATSGLDGNAKVRPNYFTLKKMENLTSVLQTLNQCLKN